MLMPTPNNVSALVCLELPGLVHHIKVRGYAIREPSIPPLQGRKFVRRLSVRRSKRLHAAITIQRVARGRAGRRKAHTARDVQILHTAARTVQGLVSRWLLQRQMLKRKILRKWGACASCCARQPEVFFAGTEQV